MNNVKQAMIVTTIAVLVGIGGIIGSTPRVQATVDAYSRGQADAYRDYNGQNGHGYDASCPSGHSDQYCANYNDGYNNAWDRLSNGQDNNNNDNVRPVNNNLQTNAQGQSSTVNVHGNNNHVNVNQDQASSQSSRAGTNLGKIIVGTLDALANSNDDPYYNNNHNHYHNYN